MAPSERLAGQDPRELMKDEALAGEWVLDPSRSTVSLRSRSVWGLVPVRGVFREVTGKGTVSPTGEVSGAITVAAASVDTRNPKRDGHLRSADFFDSDNHPHITFTVASIRPSGRGISVTGTLSVRDRARPLTFDGTAAVRADREIWLDAAIDINRGDFGLTWNPMGMVGMNSTVTVHAVFTDRN
jgi:polyisoprenoid-binding protein YceI